MKVKIEFDWSLSPEQAVLAEVVKRSHELKHPLGRTALQKIPYFLKRNGVPLSYSFDLYHYGPFCQEILWDAEMLASMGVIVDKGGYNGGSSYEVGESFEARVAEHRDFLNEHAANITAVVNLLSGLDASTLEVAATLDYFYRYVSASNAPSPRKQAVLERFYEAKPKYKAKQKDVERLYDQMAAIGMVGA